MVFCSFPNQWPPSSRVCVWRNVTHCLCFLRMSDIIPLLVMMRQISIMKKFCPGHMAGSVAHTVLYYERELCNIQWKIPFKLSKTSISVENSMFISNTWYVFKCMTDSMTWSLLNGSQQGSSGPGRRHGHSATVYQSCMYLFGGLKGLREQRDFWKWNSSSHMWTSLRNMWEMNSSVRLCLWVFSKIKCVNRSNFYLTRSWEFRQINMLTSCNRSKF